MVRLWTRAAALLVVASLWAPTVALGEDVPYKGYCEDGKPVIQYWNPKLDAKYEPACDGRLLVLQQKSSNTGNSEAPPKPINYPDDFYTWAFVTLNGKAVRNPYRDVMDFVAKSTGRTLVSIRVVTEAMGGTAEWNQETRQVTVRLGEKYMTLTIGETDAVANGNPVKVDQPPILWLGRTMVPVRVIAEAFGATVTWDDRTQEVFIQLDGVECPDAYCVEM